MEDIHQHIKNLKDSLKNIHKYQMSAIEKIKDSHPDLYEKFSKDSEKIVKAVKENDLDALNKLREDYAHSSHK
jgi:hypothetical protein